MRVICVDDEKFVLQDLINKCKEISFIDEVTGFRDSYDALDFLEENYINVAFLDIDMPDMNGLELARAIKEINPQTSIVFTTGFSKFALEAFKVHASGYLMKPVTKEALVKELENIYATTEIQEDDGSKNDHIFAQCFGNFELFVDGKPVEFSRKKAKELLAYLVDRNGAAVNRKEFAAILFEDKEYDRNVQSYLTKLIADMTSSLEAAGIGDLLKKVGDTYAVDTQKFTCDAYDFIAGKPKAKGMFFGEYMTQYSWAENSMSRFIKN